MQRLAQHSTEGQTTVPLTPQEQVRQQVAAQLIPQIAELLYRCDKGSPHAKLSDLRNEESIALYIGQARELVTPEARKARIDTIHVIDAHILAFAEKDQTDAEWQARQDVIRFKPQPHFTEVDRFGTLRPGYCYVCRDRVITNKVTVMVTPNLHGEAHASCCQDDEARFEKIDHFVYRVRGGQQ